MQIQLGEELAHLLRTSREQWQHPTDKALRQAPPPWPLHGDRPAGQGQLPRLPIPVAVSRRRIHGRAPSRLRATQPNCVTSTTNSHCSNCWIGPHTNSSRWSQRCLGSIPVPTLRSFTAVSPFLAGPRPGGFGHPKGCHRPFPISAPIVYTSARNSAHYEEL
jgi:hypothetical protein